MCMYVYIYIYIHRESDAQEEFDIELTQVLPGGWVKFDLPFEAFSACTELMIYMCVVYVYMYIYREREKERYIAPPPLPSESSAAVAAARLSRAGLTQLLVGPSTEEGQRNGEKCASYIYIYIYIEREREIDR